jgi:hypothetical protein
VNETSKSQNLIEEEELKFLLAQCYRVAIRRSGTTNNKKERIPSSGKGKSSTESDTDKAHVIPSRSGNPES